jgi:hypothetical protein
MRRHLTITTMLLVQYSSCYNLNQSMGTFIMMLTNINPMVLSLADHACRLL